jgi:hypothetical protein
VGSKIIKNRPKNDLLKIAQKVVKIDVPWGGRKSSKIDFFGPGFAVDADFTEGFSGSIEDTKIDKIR